MKSTSDRAFAKTTLYMSLSKELMRPLKLISTFDDSGVELNEGELESILHSCTGTTDVGYKGKKWTTFPDEIHIINNNSIYKKIVFVTREGLDDRILSYSDADRYKYYDCSNSKIIKKLFSQKNRFNSSPL